MKPSAARPWGASVSRRTLVSGVVASLACPALAIPTPTEIHLASDAWHGLTRKDGTGLYFDLIRAVYERHGIRLRIDIYPYARAVYLVQTKRVDAWVASFMNEKPFALYPRWHFDRNVQQVLYRTRPGYQFAGSADLRGKRVAWLRDFGLDKYIAEPVHMVEVDTIRSAMQMLEAGRVDYFIGAQSDLADDIRTRQVDMSGFEQAFLMHLGLYLAFADTPRGERLRRLWDDEMETLHKSDVFKAIFKKAGFDYPY
ncbi:MAG TPA: transporter substrate-binding domain-containing protein [Burkholderiaceae bacterium]|nr:transporter substrate-binding domain-containing protein [Burkholderiaceae bacterium]